MRKEGVCLNAYSIKSDKDAYENGVAPFIPPSSRRIVRFADNKPKDGQTVMAALIWSAITSEVAHRVAFEFKRFTDSCPRGTKFVLLLDNSQLTIAPVDEQCGDVSTPPGILTFVLNDQGAVL